MIKIIRNRHAMHLAPLLLNLARMAFEYKTYKVNLINLIYTEKSAKQLYECWVFFS